MRKCPLKVVEALHAHSLIWTDQLVCSNGCVDPVFVRGTESGRWMCSDCLQDHEQFIYETGF